MNRRKPVSTTNTPSSPAQPGHEPGRGAPAGSAAPASTADPALPGSGPQVFVWLSPSPSSEALRQNQARGRQVRRRELRERAALLRRLGYPAEAVQVRLLAYDAWEYEPFHVSPSRSDIAQIVAEVFDGSSARSDTISP